MASAVSFARALLTLSRSKRTGVLEVCGRAGQACRVAIVEGTPRAIAGQDAVGEPLGDTLLRRGELDLSAHKRALALGAPQRPVGRWLVRKGVSNAPAVSDALRRQLRARVEHVFGWSQLEYRFVEGPAEVGRDWLNEPVQAADLVLSAMRRRVSAVPVEWIAERFEGAQLRLTPLGTSLLAQAALWPEEQAAVGLLGQGVLLSKLQRVSGGSRRMMRTLLALSLLGAIQRFSSLDGRPRYGMLLRKRRQLRGAAGAHELLELPNGAPGVQARRALRRLAKDVHPDALGPHAPPELREVSNEVMGALIRAERTLSDQDRR